MLGDHSANIIFSLNSLLYLSGISVVILFETYLFLSGCTSCFQIMEDIEVSKMIDIET